MSDSKHGKFNPNNLDGKARRQNFKLEYGKSNLFRILPPFGALAASGSIAKYWSIYWLKDSRGKPKPVSSILRVGQDKRVLVPDPMNDKYQLLLKNLAAMKEAGADAAIVEALEKTVQGLRPDKGYYINVITPTNEIGTLKLRYTAFQRLKEQLGKLAKDGIDAINVGTGVYFDIQKIKDEQNKTVYTVEVHMKRLKNPETGRLTSEIVEATIDESVLKRMETEAGDLENLFKIFSPEEQALAATLDPSVIDRLFARPDAAGTDDGYEGDDEDAPVTAAQAVASAPAPVASQAAPTQVAQVAPTVNTTATAALSTQTPVTAPAVNNAPAATNPAQLQDVVGRFLRNGTIN